MIRIRANLKIPPLYCPRALSLRVSLITTQSLWGTSLPPEDEKRRPVLFTFFPKQNSAISGQQIHACRWLGEGLDPLMMVSLPDLLSPLL